MTTMTRKKISNLLADELAKYWSRRWFLKECGVGLAGVAALSLHAKDAAHAGQARPTAVKQPHYPAKAKRVIYIFQAGAPSQLEMFDHKPELANRNGQLPPRIY